MTPSILINDEGFITAPVFLTWGRLKHIVKYHGSVLFQPFDFDRLRVQPLKIKMNPMDPFRMQPCHFVREGVMRLLKEIIDLFISERVLVSD